MIDSMKEGDTLSFEKTEFMKIFVFMLIKTLKYLETTQH